MQAVIFDLFGTLVPNLPPQRWRRLYEDLAAVLEVDTDDFQDKWHAGFEGRMRGSPREVPAQIVAVLEALGTEAHPEPLARASQIKLAFLRDEALTPKPDAVETLAALQARGVKLALCTDCSWETPDLLRAGPLHAFFPVVASSAHLGVRKPDPSMYRHALGGLGVPPEHCLYVGDGNSHELRGAREQGLTTVWVDNGDAQHVRIQWSPGGDHTVRELRELLTLLSQKSEE